MRFEFSTATKIIFGRGTLGDLASLLSNYGKHPLIVTGRNPDRAAPLFDLLKSAGMSHTIFTTDGEPQVADARRGVEAAKAAGCDFVIAFGGGSALDAGKAVAGLLTNPGDPLDYLEVIGAGKPLKNPGAPFIAIPTTSGTGSEVTSNAVLASPEHKVKVSLRSPNMLARLALVDSALTHSSPPEVTAHSGLDALTQVIEPYVSNKANPFTDALCRDGIRRIAESLVDDCKDADDAVAREDMALGSLLGGIALSNAKLGAVHGFAGPIGGMFNAPHGAVCARLLPFVMEANIQALREREPEGQALIRYDLVAGRLINKWVEEVEPEDGVQWVHEVCSELKIPPLSRYGLTEADIPAIVEKSAVASSMQGNPIKLTEDEMSQILRRAL